MGGAALAVAVVAVGIAIAGPGGTYIPEFGATVPDSKVDAARHALQNGAAPPPSVAEPAPSTAAIDPIPATLSAAGATPVPLSPSLIQVVSSWLVSDGKTLVAVYAGSAGDDPATGRFVVVRQNLREGSQTQDVVDVRGAGAIAIDAAPTGAAVETTAQRGSLRFHGVRGRAGVLDLARDAVTPGS